MLKYFIYLQDHIGCVMVSMLTLNVVDLGSSPVRVIPMTLKLVFVASPLSTRH